MSDEEQEPRSQSPIGSIPLRQRRNRRSCDICRQRKIRCNGQNMPDGGSCSNCLAFGSPCTYTGPSRKRGRKQELVDELEKENAWLKTENISLKAQLRSLSVCSLCAQPLRGPVESVSSEFPHNPTESTSAESKDPFEDMTSHLSQLTLSECSADYFGPASSFSLVDRTLALKETQDRRPFRFSGRTLFWDTLPWEKEASAVRPQYVYPPNDLMDSLLRLYFTNVHPTLPILHRPSFERSVAQGLHLTNERFGGMLLSLLAVASLYSNDPRVLIDGHASLSAGWKFANQIWIVRKVFSPTIYDVQMYCLMTLYTCGASVPQNSWLYLGIGIRCLYHRGAHRRKPKGHKWNPQDELWQRAFWSFVVLERMVCSFIGRQISLPVEGYDVGLPLEVDDEYWDQGFTQPPDKPSQLSYFACDVRLSEIWSDAVRRLYASPKTKKVMGWDREDCEQRTVARFDSAMNDFRDSIPPHLRWDSDSPPQGVFFDQSAILHVTYNSILIAIHRPYIFKETPLAATSLSICANAARTIIRTSDIWLRKLQRIPPHDLINCVFVSGLILAFNLLATKRSCLSISGTKDIVLVATAVEILKVAESRIQPAGRLLDLLREVWSFDGPLPPKYPSDNQIDGSAYKGGITEPPSLESQNVPGAHLSSGFYPDFRQSAQDSSDQSSGSSPGMSIEQLLAATSTADAARSIFEDEVMSMLLACPTHINDWEQYTENRDLDTNWWSNFEAPL
ncbi:Fungal-trans domain-containing protein [Mycena sanguinolenta]|uniref:Fungal-trans domain-containing protein n=1 Tax=Mycena sanguinolenta TaxID=230812 RepID=A0A8H6WWY1_9AGAR|nr:Fungal-trans domain-containing protein [Mycena sanguinolenta]